ncbi:MAG: DUF547 domain-containing protein [Gemmatales bacterium]|nr:MAG: DUF547 domain-containing protein [Gemmatales bacterium]
MWKRKGTWLVGGAGVLVAGFALVVHFARAGVKVQVGRPCPENARTTISAVDHSSYDALLQRYVDDQGMVAYAQWKQNAADLKQLDDYLARLGCVDLQSSASKNDRLAFWINAYNALTLKGILKEYPTSSIRNHTAKIAGYNIWKDLLLWVDGQYYSLDDIEHSILRRMGEPRIHFAIVCASKGCPQLWNHAYSGKNLDAELTANARRFFAKPANFRADAQNRTVYLSQLLQWYGRDFASTSAGQLQRLRPYFPHPEQLGWLNGKVTVRYLPYDWSLNDRAPVAH